MSTFNIGGNAGQSFPFDNIGDTVTGKVSGLEEVQQTDMQTGEPAFWQGGQPKMMYRVDLATDLRDPDNPHDDGARSVYLRGSRKSATQSSLAAVLDAVRAATGGSELAAGGTLTLTYVADGQRTRAGYNPPKMYAARYVPPTADLAAPSTPPPAAAAPAAAAQAAPAPVSVPVATVTGPAIVNPATGVIEQPVYLNPTTGQPYTADQVTALIAAGVDLTQFRAA